jgi:hypothetical protein
MMRVTSGKSRVRESRLPGSVRAEPNGRATRPRSVPRYLAEFEYRFNRRYDLAAMLPRLATAPLQTPPMPYRLLKRAEVAA